MAVITSTLTFKTVLEYRRWLSLHHASETSLWVLLAKKHIPAPKLTYDELVEESLCWGWIDGLVNKWDADYRAIRVTPRKPRSIWSPSNVARIERLAAQGRIQPPGQKLIDVARHHGTWAAGVRRKTSTMPAELKRALAKNAKARRFFEALTPGRKRMVFDWIEDAKQAETKTRRIAKAVAASGRGERLF